MKTPPQLQRGNIKGKHNEGERGRTGSGLLRLFTVSVHFVPLCLSPRDYPPIPIQYNGNNNDRHFLLIHQVSSQTLIHPSFYPSSLSLSAVTSSLHSLPLSIYYLSPFWIELLNAIHVDQIRHFLLYFVFSVVLNFDKIDLHYAITSVIDYLDNQEIDPLCWIKSSSISYRSCCLNVQITFWIRLREKQRHQIDGAVQTLLLSQATRSPSRDLREGLWYVT